MTIKALFEAGDWEGAAAAVNEVNARRYAENPEQAKAADEQMTAAFHADIRAVLATASPERLEEMFSEAPELRAIWEGGGR